MKSTKFYAKVAITLLLTIAIFGLMAGKVSASELPTANILNGILSTKYNIVPSSIYQNIDLRLGDPAATLDTLTYTINEIDETIIITGYTGSVPDVAIPSQINGMNVTIIQDGTFPTGVENVYIPDTVIGIGENAFANTTGVTIICQSESIAKAFAQNNDIAFSLDDTAPSLFASYSPVDTTNGTVSVSITGSEQLQAIDGWTLSYDRKTLTKDYEENGDWEIPALDLVGNTSTVNIHVSTIDKQAPSLAASYDPAVPTNTDVSVMIVASEPIQEVEGWVHPKASATNALVKTFTENGEEVVTVKDLFNNEAEITITVDFIDKTSPTGTVAYNPTGETYDPVTVTITASEPVQEIDGWALSVDGLTLTKIYKDNKEETVTITDAVGNTSEVEVNVTNVKKVLPGDINRDEKLTATDLLKAKRIAVGLDEASDKDKEILDLNESGDFTVTDILLLKRKLVGLDK